MKTLEVYFKARMKRNTENAQNAAPYYLHKTPAAIYVDMSL